MKNLLNYYVNYNTTDLTRDDVLHFFLFTFNYPGNVPEFTKICAWKKSVAF